MSVYVLHIKSRVGQKVTSLKRLGEIFFFSHASLQSWFLIRGRKLLKVSVLIPLFLNMTHSGCLRRLL